MFIYNINLGKTKLFKIIFVLMIFTVILLCIYAGFKIFNKKNNDTCFDNNFTDSNVNNKNYTSILKAVHDNIDSYIGIPFKYSGFIYRVYDLEKNEFILGRNMIISSDMQTVIVGFLCKYDDAINFSDFSWVEIEGTIEKTTYHNESMPIIKINKINKIQKPDNEYVYPPDENYVPTTNIF